MRTKELKINGDPVEAVLMAGGPGFKIYHASDSLVVVKGRKQIVFKEDDPDFKTVIRYVNLRYQPAGEHEKVKADFDALIKIAPEVSEAANDGSPKRYKDAIDKVEKKLYSRMRRGKIKSKLGKKGKSKIPGFGYFFKRD